MTLNSPKRYGGYYPPRLNIWTTIGEYSKTTGEFNALSIYTAQLSHY